MLKLPTYETRFQVSKLKIHKLRAGKSQIDTTLFEQRQIFNSVEL